MRPLRCRIPESYRGPETCGLVPRQGVLSLGDRQTHPTGELRIQASSKGRWGHKPAGSGVRGCLALQPRRLQIARGNIHPGLRMWMEGQGQHGPLGTAAPKSKGLSMSTGRHCGYKRRSALHSSRNLGQGPESLGSRPSPMSNLLRALEQVPASRSPFLSFPIGTRRGRSSVISKDMPFPRTSAVQRPQRRAKGSQPVTAR